MVRFGRIELSCTACALLVAGWPVPGRAGWDSGAADFIGTWSTSWESPTGAYKSGLQLTGSTGAGTVVGHYDNGTVTGQTIPLKDTNGKIIGWTYDGKWQRTSGDSGGRCPYGRFSLRLANPTVVNNGTANLVSDLTFDGKWTYCNDDPHDAALSQQWSGNQPLNLNIDEYLLPVPLDPQLTNMWCWAASSEMIVQYLFPPVQINQGQEADFNTGRTDCTADPTPGSCIAGGMQEFSHYAVSFRSNFTETDSKVDPALAVPGKPNNPIGHLSGSVVALSWTDLQASINSGQPVMFAYAWRVHPNVAGDRYLDGGHMMVARGWATSADVNYVLVNNPWPPELGDEDIVPYDEWVGGTDAGSDHVHWADYWDFGRGNSASNIPSGSPAGSGRDARSPAPPPPALRPEPRPVLVVQSIAPIARLALFRDEAARALPLVRQLASKKMAGRALGFSSAAQAAQTTVGRPIQEYYVSTPSLAHYSGAEPLSQLIGSSATVLFPLVADGEIHSAARFGLRGEQPRIASLGNASLIRRIAGIAELRAAPGETEPALVTAIRIPALGLYFVAREVSGQLEVASPFDVLLLGVRSGQFEPDLPP